MVQVILREASAETFVHCGRLSEGQLHRLSRELRPIIGAYRR